jgi:ribosomal protein S18 acetylase RimI-like enzyme
LDDKAGESGVTVIRQATVDDVETLTPLFDSYRQFYGQEPDLPRARAFLTERFKQRESIIFLASNGGGECVGFVQLYPSFSSVRTARIFILNDLFVCPAGRRAGVAGELLREAARFARAVGAIKLTLSTAHTNEPAQKLYESLGWKLDQDFRSYVLTI